MIRRRARWAGAVDMMTRIFRLGGAAAVLVAAVAVAGNPVAGWAAGARPATIAAPRAAHAGAVAATAPGTRLWAARYQGIGGDSRASQGVVSPDSSTVFVTGSDENTNSTLPPSAPVSVFATVAYNAVTGKRLWIENFHGPDRGANANSIAVSPDGSKVFVTGQAYIGDPIQGTDMATIAYNAKTGHYLWSRLYSGPIFGAGSANSVTVSPDGSKVFITGGTYGNSTGNYYLSTVAYNSSTGAMLWSKRTVANPGTTIATSPDGSKVYVSTGNEGGAGTGTATPNVVAYSAATGHQLWAGSFSGPGNLIRCELAVDPDGTKVFSTCTTDVSPARYLTLAYNSATGKQVWVATYQHSGIPSNDDSTSAAITATSSRVFVTGTSVGHIGTVAYNASTGSQQWVSLYPTPGGTSASGQAITLSPGGSTVYAAGGANTSYAVAAFNAATGTRRWAKQWFGDGGGGAFSVAASPDGDGVFLTGVTSIPAGGDSFSAGYGTVAYQP